MRGSLLLLALLGGGCKSEDGAWEPNELEGDRLGRTCPSFTVDLTTNIDSTNPFAEVERVLDQMSGCWNQRIDADEREKTSEGELTKILLDGSPPVGCQFRLEGDDNYTMLVDGDCVIPRDTGYLRVRQLEPATWQWEYQFQVEIPRVAIEEVRGDDLYTGTGRAFLNWPMSGGAPPEGEYDPRIPLDPNASCALPACSTVAFAGKGSVRSGNATVCAELLTAYANPFNLYFDAQNRMSFDAATPDAMKRPTVLGQTTCAAHAWVGERTAYPYRRYYFDTTTSQLVLDEEILHTSGPVTDVCKIRWETTVTGC